jgi:hypothetical protein
LRHLFLSGNNISDFNDSSFYGLEQLEHLDLSNNNIKEFSPLVFQHFMSVRYGGDRVSKLKYLNLARNKILYFNLEEYLPFDSRGNSSVTTFQLVFLNLSSNRLESLDAASVKWLNQSGTEVDLAGNPWRCECAGLWEAWRELHNKLTLFCASPRRLEGKTWGVIEILCPEMNPEGGFCAHNNKTNETSATCHCLSTESSGKEQKENIGIYISVAKTLVIINGVILVCSLGGGVFILVRYVKKPTKSSEVSEKSLVHVHPAPTCSSVRMPSNSNPNSGDVTGHVYETIM